MRKLAFSIAFLLTAAASLAGGWFLGNRHGAAPAEPPKGGIDAEPEITEQRACAAFQEMLGKANVDAEVARFHFKALRWYSVRQYIDPKTGGVVDLAKPFKRIALVYEADLLFRADCQLKEEPHLLWLPGHEIGTGMVSVVNGQQLPFRKGHRQAVRGVIFVRLDGPEWNIDCALWPASKGGMPGDR